MCSSGMQRLCMCKVRLQFRSGVLSCSCKGGRIGVVGSSRRPTAKNNYPQPPYLANAFNGPLEPATAQHSTAQHSTAQLEPSSVSDAPTHPLPDKLEIAETAAKIPRIRMAEYIGCKTSLITSSGVRYEVSFDACAAGVSPRHGTPRHTYCATACCRARCIRWTTRRVH